MPSVQPLQKPPETEREALHRILGEWIDWLDRRAEQALELEDLRRRMYARRPAAPDDFDEEPVPF